MNSNKKGPVSNESWVMDYPRALSYQIRWGYFCAHPFQGEGLFWSLPILAGFLSTNSPLWLCPDLTAIKDLWMPGFHSYILWEWMFESRSYNQKGRERSMTLVVKATNSPSLTHTLKVDHSKKSFLPGCSNRASGGALLHNLGFISFIKKSMITPLK